MDKDSLHRGNFGKFSAAAIQRVYFEETRGLLAWLWRGCGVAVAFFWSRILTENLTTSRIMLMLDYDTMELRNPQ